MSKNAESNPAKENLANGNQAELGASIERNPLGLEAVTRHLDDKLMGTEEEIKGRKGFMGVFNELSSGKAGVFFKGMVGALILGGSVSMQQSRNAAGAFLEQPEPRAELNNDLDLTGPEAEVKMNRQGLQEKLFDLFDTEEFVDSLMVGKIISEIMEEVEAKISNGEVLVGVDGIWWTWKDSNGQESTTIIEALVENRTKLSEQAAGELADHEEQIEKEKREAKLKEAMARRIDMAAKKIGEIYGEILKDHDIDQVAPLDNEEIDKYLQAGYVNVLPLYDGVGKNMLGFVMKNFSVNDKVIFELVVEKQVVEDGASVAELTLEDITLVPEDLQVRLDDARRKMSLVENYFPEVQQKLDDPAAMLLGKSEVTIEEYDEHSSKLASTRNIISQGTPELEELNTKITDGVAGLSEMFKAGASIEERQEYVNSLDLYEQLDTLKQSVVRGSEGEASLDLLGQAMSLEIETASMWEKVSE